MGDLDFDVRITTEHVEPAALMREVGHAMARGTFRVPARIEAARALDVIVAAKTGAIALRGKAEVVGYEGAHTWLRFLSADGDEAAEANVVLTGVHVELGERYRRSVAAAAASGPAPAASAPNTATASPAPAPSAATASPAPSAARITKSHPAVPRVVSVPPKPRATSAERDVASAAKADPARAPRRGFASHDAVPAALPATVPPPVVARRVPPAPPASRGAASPPARSPPVEASAPTAVAEIDTARVAATSAASDYFAAPLPAPPQVALEGSSPALRDDTGRPPLELAQPPALASAAPTPSSPLPMGQDSAPVNIHAFIAAAAANGRAKPAPSEPPASASFSNERQIATTAAPSLSSELPQDRQSSERAAPSADPFRRSDSVARLGTAPIDATHDHARAYADPTLPPHPTPSIGRPAPLNARERRMLGASLAIAAGGVVIALSAVLWASRARLTPPPAEAAQACEPTPPDGAAAPRPAAAAVIVAAPAAVPAALIACELDITSNAGGAEIWLDGEKQGVVPARLTVPCRPSQLALRHPRYVAESRAVAPTPGTTQLAVRMTRPLVTMTIQSTPPGATVRVNGKEIGKTPAQTKVYAFERGTVVLSHDGGAIKTMQIYPQSDNTVLSATLPKPKLKKARR